MARYKGAEAVYEVASLFRDRCLTRGESLLWPNGKVWTVQNLSALWDAFIGRPDASQRSFFEKWKDQLASCPPEVHKVAADIIAFYHLFPVPDKVSRPTKLSDIRTVISWKLSEDPPDLSLLDRAFEQGIGGPGMYYLTGRPWQVAFYLEFSRRVLSGEADPNDPDACKKLALVARDRVRRYGGRFTEAPNIMLHLLFPDIFERIASENDKRSIAKAFGNLTDGANDLDEALQNIRRQLSEELGRNDIDFYDDEDIGRRWMSPERATESYGPASDLLRRIADLLGSKRLDDPDVIDAEKWKSTVQPVTRPFLEQVRRRLGLGDGHFYSGRMARSKRGCFDRWDLRLGHLSLGVSVGFADAAGQLAQALCWGVYWWGKTEDASPAEERLRTLSVQGSGFRAIRSEAEQAVGFGGTDVALLKSLKPDEVRACSVDDLLREITLDLRALYEPLAADQQCDMFLVGAARDATDYAAQVSRQIEETGRAAVWWSFPVTGEKEEALRRCPYLYIYAGVPTQKLTHRQHVVDFRASTGDQGMLCPWPEHARPGEREGTAAGPHKSEIFKTWFLVDDIETLDPPMPLEELERSDGGSARPESLVAGFAVWRPRISRQDALGELAKELLIDRTYLVRVKDLLEDKPQAIFYGPPGTGKTYVARKLADFLAGHSGSVRLVQFHPSYAYEDFVEGYRPRGSAFVLVEGPLKKVAQAARENPDSTHFLLIDEINRGNVAKVFGELYFLLEYRDEGVLLQYSNEPFSLPRNLWIIGTMNTADRSIALIDAALRRRFYFVPFFPDEPPVEGLLRRWLQQNKPDLLWVADVVDRANNVLADRQAAIGPSYFLKPGLTSEWVELIWKHSIIPYLAERFLGEEDRLQEFSLEVLRDASRTLTGQSSDELPDTAPDADRVQD